MNKHFSPFTLESCGEVSEQLTSEMARTISDEIDNELINHITDYCRQLQMNEEAKLRAEFPMLQAAWEEYQVALRLIQSGSQTLERK